MLAVIYGDLDLVIQVGYKQNIAATVEPSQTQRNKSSSCQHHPHSQVLHCKFSSFLLEVVTYTKMVASA